MQLLYNSCTSLSWFVQETALFRFAENLLSAGVVKLTISRNGKLAEFSPKTPSTLDDKWVVR